MQTTLTSAIPTDQYRPTLIIDERERKDIREAVQKVAHAAGLLTEIRTLDLGDYLVSDSIAIERKRGDDLASSLCDARFFTQLTRLATHYSCPILLLENFERMFSRHIYDASLYGALLYTCTKLGIRCLPSRDSDHTAQILTSLVEHYQTSPSHSPKMVSIAEDRVSVAAQRYFLEGLLDVSEKRSAQLLETFGTPFAVLHALRTTKLTFTKTGKVKGIEGPLTQVAGLGVKFVQKNHVLLRMAFAQSVHVTKEDLTSIL